MTQEEKKTTSQQAGEQARQIKINFNTNDLKSSYANFCNVTSTREEVVMNFGLNQDWDRNRREIRIDLSHRLILSPFAAKRLHQMLSTLIENYEKRFGTINIEPQEGQGAGPGAAGGNPIQ